MSNPLLQAGATPAKQYSYAPIFTNRFFTGLWTQRNPMRDAATPFLYEKFYTGARFESLIDGLNVEITSRLTLGRRPGFITYNSQTFPAINAFYGFKLLTSTGTESIKLIADTSNNVYDATGPNTKTSLLTKGVGSGQTYFQSVGNTLYMGDGAEQMKYIQSPISWQATTAFTSLGSNQPFIIDTNGNIQQVTLSGTSGGSQPAWATTVRFITTDGTVQWTNRGPATQKWSIAGPTTAPIYRPSSLLNTSSCRFWAPNQSYPAAYTLLDSNGNLQLDQGAFTSGSVLPSWNRNAGTLTNDGGTNAWRNRGPYTIWQPNVTYPNFNVGAVQDANNNVQIASAGTTGTGVPGWNNVFGGNTVDNTVTWTTGASGQVIAFFGYKYCYAYHYIDGGLSSASPLTQSTGPIIGTGLGVDLTLTGIADGQCDLLYVFRTTDGGATPLFLGSVPNTGAGSIGYSDSAPDTQLNPLITAPLLNANDPPPAGMINLAYHLNRIFGSVGNITYYSGAPLATAGLNVENFPPSNTFTWPSKVIRHVPTAQGLLVFTTSDIYFIGGQGTSSSPLFPGTFLKGIGIANFNALDLIGSVIYIHTSDNQLLSIDPGAGYAEPGFPIGDQIQSTYSPSTSYVTYHSDGSSDKGLYLADGSQGYFRLNPTPSPENGLTWSPKALLNSGFGLQALQSIETSPGIRKLLAGPSVGNGPILQRSRSASQDNNQNYSAFFTIGSIVLALPGQLAELSFITTESTLVGSAPTMSVLIDEISGTFSSLNNSVNDPPMLASVGNISSTLYSKRFYFSQSQKPAWCRHLQIKFTWPTENAQNELLTYTIFGRHWQEK